MNVCIFHFTYILYIPANYKFTITPHQLSQDETKVLLSQSSVQVIEAIDAIDTNLKKLSEHNPLDNLVIVEVPSNILPIGKFCLGRHNFLYVSDKPGYNLYCLIKAAWKSCNQLF